MSHEDYKMWKALPFKSVKNLVITGIVLMGALLLITIFVDDWISASNRGQKILDHYLAISASMVANIVFFIFFTWGIIEINKRRPFFRLLDESDDFTDEEVRKTYQEIMRKITVFNDVMYIDFDVKSFDDADPNDRYCNVDITIIQKISNLSRHSPYHDKKLRLHDPTGPSSKESAQLLVATIGDSHEEVLRSDKLTSPKWTKRDGKLVFEEALDVAAGGSKWSRSLYRYRLPVRTPGRSLEQCEEHNFTSHRITKEVTLRAKNSSSQPCIVIVESTKEGSARNSRLEVDEGDFRNLVTLAMVDPYDSGAIQVYVEYPVQTPTHPIQLEQ